MNHITNQTFQDTIKALQVLITKKTTVDEAKIKQLIKVQTTKLSQELTNQGMDKTEIFNYVEDIFGKQNFQNGKYKGGREVVIETIQEFFGGKENFPNGKFIGGWNEAQDLKNIQGEPNKAVISAVVEEKLGGQEKFAGGKYNSEAEITKIVEKGYKNRGPFLRILRDIMGEKEFFPEESGEGIPPGREGMRRDPEAIALQNADKQARIEAIAKWREFYEDHGIVDSNNQLFWSNKYGSNVKTAEGVYKDAILKAAEIVGEDKPLNDLEKNRINKAPTPEKIQAVLEDIPKQRRAKEWNNFFEKHDILNNIDEKWKDN